MGNIMRMVVEGAVNRYNIEGIILLTCVTRATEYRTNSRLCTMIHIVRKRVQRKTILIRRLNFRGLDSRRKIVKCSTIHNTIIVHEFIVRYRWFRKRFADSCPCGTNLLYLCFEEILR